MTAHEARPVVLCFAYHRLHCFVYQRLFAELRSRGAEPICALFGEHVVNGQIEGELVDALAAECEVVRLDKTLGERLMVRLVPRWAPGSGRDASWGRRGSRLIERFGSRLECVVVPMESAGRYLAPAARRYGRFVALQYEPFIQYGKSKTIARLEAELFCAWGQQDSKGLRRAGVTAPIYPAGSPIVELASRFDFPPLARDRPLTVLYTTTPLLRQRRLDFAVRLPFTMEDYREMKLAAMRDLHALVTQHPQISVVVKLHPMDEGKVERDFLETVGDVSMSLLEHQPTVPIAEHIAASDLLVTLGSTTAFQAICSGTPVVFLNYGSWTGKHEMGYLAYTFALAATDSSSLLWAVEKTLGDPSTQAVLENGRRRYLGQVVEADGEEAVERTCDALMGRLDPAMV